MADALSRLCADTPLARPKAVLLAMSTRGRKKALEIIAAAADKDVDKTEDEIADSIEEAEDYDDSILLSTDDLDDTTIDPTTALPIPPVDITPDVLLPGSATVNPTMALPIPSADTTPDVHHRISL